MRESVRALTERNVRIVRELKHAARAHRTFAERLADAITRFCGSMTFVWLHAIWFLVWIAANATDSFGLRFDPFPFSLLTMIVSLEAIFLSTFILISQNREQQLADRLNQLDLQINLLSEQENTKMLQILQAVAEKVGAEIEREGEIETLEETKRPEQLVRTLDARIERGSER